MLKLKNKNGITLIALIITIIVMLILVGVTLNMVLDENGIIAEAKKAKEKMESAAESETLQSAVLGAIGTDGKIDFEKLDQNLPTGFEGTNGIYESSNGNRYAVSKSGEVTYLEGKLATYVEYKDLMWRVLKDDETGVELLSENTLGELSLTVRNGTGMSLIPQYIIAHCQEILNEEVDPYQGNIRAITEDDLPRMAQLGLIVSGNIDEYFVASWESISSEDNPDLQRMFAHYVDSNGDVVPVHVLNYYPADSTYATQATINKPVRPIYTFEVGALDNLEGSGAIDDPYILAD